MSKIFNKDIFKKWWFWLIVVVVLVAAVSTSGNESDIQGNNTPTESGVTQQNGTLPILSSSDYIDKEGLVVFKDLSEEKYTVTAQYVNDKLADANQELTEDFKRANVSSCSDRLGWDAYVVSDLKQTGDTINLVMTIKANSNQECPEGTTNDLQ